MKALSYNGARTVLHLAGLEVSDFPSNFFTEACIVYNPLIMIFTYIFNQCQNKRNRDFKDLYSCTRVNLQIGTPYSDLNKCVNALCQRALTLEGPHEPQGWLLSSILALLTSILHRTFSRCAH